MARVAALGLIAVLAGTMLAACGGGAPASTKYVQTWTKAYAETTCDDWNVSMNDHQRFVMAGDMLLRVRQGDGDGSVPADEMIAGFESAIQSVCSAGFGQLGGKVAEAAAVAYAADVTYHP